jgi:hypothetical protein
MLITIESLHRGDILEVFFYPELALVFFCFESTSYFLLSTPDKRGGEYYSSELRRKRVEKKVILSSLDPSISTK